MVIKVLLREMLCHKSWFVADEMFMTEINTVFKLLDLQ